MARDVITAFAKEFGRLLSPMEIEQVNSWLKEFQEPIVLEALKRASLTGKPMVSYISGILTNWRKNNLWTLSAIKEWESNFKARGGTKGGQAWAPDDKDSKKRAFIRSLYI
ncbi:MAG: DnaD domain protein [Desulfotomaculaceae bacterium]|nr:DnaD domain protein [Desulfotomaculaceae bacterium]